MDAAGVRRGLGHELVGQVIQILRTDVRWYDAHVMAYDTDQDLHQIEIRDGDGSPVVINWYDLNEPHRGVRVNGITTTLDFPYSLLGARVRIKRRTHRRTTLLYGRVGALDHRSNQQNVKLDSGEDVWLSIGNLLDTHEAQLLTEYDSSIIGRRMFLRARRHDDWHMFEVIGFSRPSNQHRLQELQRDDSGCVGAVGEPIQMDLSTIHPVWLVDISQADFDVYSLLGRRIRAYWWKLRRFYEGVVYDLNPPRPARTAVTTSPTAVHDKYKHSRSSASAESCEADEPGPAPAAASPAQDWLVTICYDDGDVRERPLHALYLTFVDEAPGLPDGCGDEDDGGDEDSDDDMELRHSPAPVGLINVGNSCYLSAVLQALVRVRPLNRFVLQPDLRRHMTPDNAHGMAGLFIRAYSVLVRLFCLPLYRNLYGTTATLSGGAGATSVGRRSQRHEQEADNQLAFAPGHFRGVLAQRDATFQGSDQQDAHEVLMTILDGLHEDVVVTRTADAGFSIQLPTAAPAAKLSLIQRLFRRKRSVVTPRASESSARASDAKESSLQSETEVQATSAATYATSMIRRLFFVRTLSFVTCQQCQHSSAVPGPNDGELPPSLPLPSKRARRQKLQSSGRRRWMSGRASSRGEGRSGLDLLDCLKLYFDGEAVTMTCDTCKRSGVHLLRPMLLSTPPYLMLHLKRFEFVDEYRRRKLTMPVRFPLRGLSLDEFMYHGERESTLDQTRAQYTLFALIYHVGDMEVGHYITYVRSGAGGGEEAGNWLRCDDELVTAVEEADVLSTMVAQGAYMLFYVQEGREGAESCRGMDPHDPPPPTPLRIAAPATTDPSFATAAATPLHSTTPSASAQAVSPSPAEVVPSPTASSHASLAARSTPVATEFSGLMASVRLNDKDVPLRVNVSPAK